MKINNLFLQGLIAASFFTIISCCSAKKTIDEDKMLNKKYDIPISIPPGTADIKAEIINFSEEKENYLCKIKINEVFKYGASTLPLPPGTEIESYIPKNLVNRESKRIENGEIIFARISEVRGFGDVKYWEIIMFNK